MSFDLQLFGSYSNYDYYTEFNGSSSADTMYNHASNVIINAGAGDDYIENYGSNTVTINGGTGNDTISRLGNSNVIAYASGDGNDSVAYSAYTSTVNIKITDDSSYTTSNGALGSTVVQIGSGSITIERGQSQTINIEGGSNNSAPDTSGHSYSNYDYYTTFNGGVGNDTMYNHASNVIIDAGDGDDYIDNYGNNTVTIKGGAGDDTIYRVGSNNVIEYAAGDGNDSVAASAYTSTINIKITDDSTYVTTAGALSSKIIEFDNGSITIEQGQNQTVSIEGGVYVGGPDTVGHSYSNYDYYTTFNGGLGNDTMYNHASNVIIDAGDGDDYIDNYGNNTVTIKGGAGNDTIYRVGSNNVIEYASGDGNDSVAYSAYTNTINIDITDGSSYSTAEGDLSAMIVNIGGGSIVIERGMTQEVNINGGNVSSGGSMPNGLNKVGDTINVSTNYNGGVWLTGFDILNWRECYADATAIEVNASSDGTSGRVIVGNEQSNMLRAGYNGAWLWGYLGDDTLVGGAGSDMFWFGKGEGSDVIDDCNDNDLVNLWSINLSDVMSFDVDDNDNISVGFSDGNRLKVNTTGSSTTFQLADVGRWKLDHGSRSFSYVPS